MNMKIPHEVSYQIIQGTGDLIVKGGPLHAFQG